MLTHALPKAANSKFPFLLLIAFLTVVFATGGSARNDAVQTVFLYPVSLAFLGCAMLTIQRHHIADNISLLCLIAAILALPALHLVALVPSLTESASDTAYFIFQSRSPIADVVATGTPLTPSSAGGWHSVQTLVIPLTVTLLGIQIDKEKKFFILSFLIFLSTMSGLLGLLQSISSPTAPIYFYQVSNSGAAVGLFANRNHAATLLACLFPMLSAYASSDHISAGENRRQRLIAAGIGVILVPLILVTGSRSGLLMAVVGLVGAALIYRAPVKFQSPMHGRITKTRDLRGFLAAFVAIGLALTTFLLSRAEAVERIFNQDVSESRAEFLLVSQKIFYDHFPWGVGPGTFVETYQFIEPTYLLDPSYLNRLHNDWAETALTFGAPGIIILFVGLLSYCRRSYRLWSISASSRRSLKLGRMASIALGIIGLASFSDYPLRTPIIMAVTAVLTLWLIDTDSAQPASEV